MPKISPWHFPSLQAIFSQPLLLHLYKLSPLLLLFFFLSFCFLIHTATNSRLADFVSLISCSPPSLSPSLLLSLSETSFRESCPYERAPVNLHLPGKPVFLLFLLLLFCFSLEAPPLLAFPPSPPARRATLVARIVTSYRDSVRDWGSLWRYIDRLGPHAKLFFFFLPAGLSLRFVVPSSSSLDLPIEASPRHTHSPVDGGCASSSFSSCSNTLLTASDHLWRALLD